LTVGGARSNQWEVGGEERVFREEPKRGGALSTLMLMALGKRSVWLTELEKVPKGQHWRNLYGIKETDWARMGVAKQKMQGAMVQRKSERTKKKMSEGEKVYIYKGERGHRDG